MWNFIEFIGLLVAALGTPLFFIWFILVWGNTALTYIVAYNPLAFRSPTNKMRRAALKYLRIPNTQWKPATDESFVHIVDATTAIKTTGDVVINGVSIPDKLIRGAGDDKFAHLGRTSRKVRDYHMANEILEHIQGKH